MTCIYTGCSLQRLHRTDERRADMYLVGNVFIFHHTGVQKLNNPAFPVDFTWIPGPNDFDRDDIGVIVFETFRLVPRSYAAHDKFMKKLSFVHCAHNTVDIAAIERNLSAHIRGEL